jgi:DNA-binding NarL/FixJ family response regulator
MIRVLIVADSPLSRAGFENLLASREVVVAASTGSIELLAEQISDAGADAVLIEARGDLEDLLGAITRADIANDAATVILADQAPPEWTAAALRAGIRAVLPRDISGAQLIAALQASTAGLIVVHPEEISPILRISNPAPNPLPELPEPLTPREQEVLQMLAGGIGNKQIASRLSISEHTVKFHVTSIFGKLGVSSRTEAVSAGIRHGLVLL